MLKSKVAGWGKGKSAYKKNFRNQKVYSINVNERIKL